MGLFALSIVMILFSAIFAGKPRFLANALGTIVVPFQSASESISRFLSGKIESITKLSDLQEENKQLREENEELRFLNSRLQAIEKENKRLSDLLKTANRYAEFETVGAHVIAKDPGNWYNSFLINKGIKDGVNKDMVVLGDGGLIGRVTEVGNHHAKIVAMIDDSSTVSAMGVRTEDIGYIKGDISLMLDGFCRMEFLDEDAQLMEGDEIVTSHLSSLYPPGISIGVVKEILPDAKGTKYALVEPTVNFEKLEMVLVITEEFQKLYPADLIDSEGFEEQ